MTDNIESYSSICELQSGLIVALYFVNTSKLDLAHRLLHVVASSPIVYELFQVSMAQISGTSIDNVFWVVNYLDSHVSWLLGIPSQLNCPAITSMTIQAINVAVHNVAAYKRSDTAFLLSVSLAIAIESLRLIKCTTPDVPEIIRPTASLSEYTTPPINIHRCIEVEMELKTLESAFRRIFSDDDANPQISL